MKKPATDARPWPCWFFLCSFAGYVVDQVAAVITSRQELTRRCIARNKRGARGIGVMCSRYCWHRCIAQHKAGGEVRRGRYSLTQTREYRHDPARFPDQIRHG